MIEVTSSLHALRSSKEKLNKRRTEVVVGKIGTPLKLTMNILRSMEGGVINIQIRLPK